MNYKKMGILNFTSSFLSLLALINDQVCIPKEVSYGMVCVCNTKCDSTSPVTSDLPNGYYFHIETTQSGDRLKRSIKPNNITKTTARYAININENKKGQTILGWGGTFTDSSTSIINSLNENVQNNLMKSYFSKDGLELSLCRVPIGATDFSNQYYSLDPVVFDTNLTHFNLSNEDFTLKIPMIQKAMELSQFTLNLFASASSAPLWMLDGTSMGAEYLQTWADYHIKFLEAYQNQGINFWGMTTGYEPVSYSITYPNSNRVKWAPDTMHTWITQNLGPSLKNSSFSNITLMTYDDQRSLISWANKGLLTPELTKYVKGITIHTAANTLFESTLFKDIQRQNPDYFYLSTDVVADKQVPLNIGSWYVAEDYARKIIQDLNNKIVGHVDFNLALDMEGGSTYINRYANVPIVVNTTAGEFYKQPIFYILGHFSKYVPPGSVYLNSTHKMRNVYVSAFQRPDNGTVLVILNQSSRDMQVDVVVQGKPNVTINIQKHSINSVVYWK